MTPASTDEGESTATLRPPAAAITKASFAAIEVMSSTFPNFRIEKIPTGRRAYTTQVQPVGSQSPAGQCGHFCTHPRILGASISTSINKKARLECRAFGEGARLSFRPFAD
jgi:hypothetical protein